FTWPCVLIPRHGFVVIPEIVIVSQTRAMLEKHSQRVGALRQSVVEPQYAVTHERKGSRRDQRLRKAPPSHDGIGTVIPDDTFSRGNCDRDIHAQVISLFPGPSKQVPYRR